MTIVNKEFITKHMILLLTILLATLSTPKSVVNGTIGLSPERAIVGDAPDSSPAIVTAYSCGGLKTEAEIKMNCPSLLSGKPKTATGDTPIPYKTIACDKKYLGKSFELEGYGVVKCNDRGGRIVGNKIDLYVETVQEARKFGVKKLSWREI